MVSLLFGPCIASLLLGAEDLEQRFRDEYPAALAAQDLAASQVTYRGRTSFRFFTDEEEFSDKLTVARDGGRIVIAAEGARARESQSKEAKPASSQVNFGSPNLRFRLAKKSNKCTYVIIRHEEKFIGDDGIFLAESKLMTVPHSMTGVTEIQKKLDSPNFQIVGFRREQFEGESLARLEYTRLAENGEAYTGWVDFDPAHNWVVRRWSRTQTKNPTDSSDLINTAMNIDYRLIDPTHYLPRRIEQTFHALKPNLRQRRLVEYDEIIVGPPDESLFRLSGYGLPDVPLRPLTAAAGPSLLGNAWFWASLVVGALSLSALVFSRSRRASASAGN